MAKSATVNMIAALIAQRERMALSATDVDRPRGHGPISDDPVIVLEDTRRHVPGFATTFKRDAKDCRIGTPVFNPNDGPAPDRPRTREEIISHNDLVKAREEEARYAARRKYGG